MCARGLLPIWASESHINFIEICFNEDGKWGTKTMGPPPHPPPAHRVFLRLTINVQAFQQITGRRCRGRRPHNAFDTRSQGVFISLLAIVRHPRPLIVVNGFPCGKVSCSDDYPDPQNLLLLVFQHLFIICICALVAAIFDQSPSKFGTDIHSSL